MGVQAALGRSEHHRGAPNIPGRIRASPEGSLKIAGGTEHPRGTPAWQIVLSIPRSSGHPKGIPALEEGRLPNIPRDSSIPGGHEHPRHTALPPSPIRSSDGCSHRVAGAELPEKRRRNRGRREAIGAEETALQCQRCHRSSAEGTEQVSGYRSAPQGPEPRRAGAAAAPPGTGQPLPPPFQALRDRAMAQPRTGTAGFLLLAKLLNLRKHKISLSSHHFPMDLQLLFHKVIPQGPRALRGGRDHPVPTFSFAAYSQQQRQLVLPGRYTNTSAA